MVAAAGEVVTGPVAASGSGAAAPAGSTVGWPSMAGRLDVAGIGARLVPADIALFDVETRHRGDDGNDGGRVRHGAGAVSGAANPGASGSGSGREPVVKSYPQFSQNSASGRFGNEQFGQVIGSPEPDDGVDAGAATGAAGAGAAAAMGVPQTSQ